MSGSRFLALVTGTFLLAIAVGTAAAQGIAPRNTDLVTAIILNAVTDARI